MVATRSSNLKGTFQRALKNAAASIKTVVEALRERTASEEVRRLQAENSSLRRDLDDLRRQVVELRGQRSQQSAPTCLQRPEEGLVEKVSASVIRSVGRMIDARFAGLEDRLLPAKTLRPPLAADRKKKERTTQKAPSSSATPAPVKKRRAHVSEEAALAVQTGDGEWTTVAKRAKKKKTAPMSYAAAAAATPASKGPQPQSPAKKKKAKKPKLSAPRSPAVLVTLDEYAESKGVTSRHCHLLKQAADTIDLAELGIVGGLKLRRAATGARLLELPKGQTPEAAGRLAEAMQEALGSMAKVVQPIKLAGVRISGLDDSVSCEMVAEAVAKSSAPCAALNAWESGTLALPVRLRLTAAARASGVASRGTSPAIAPGHCTAPFVLPPANRRRI
ncbi:unnamed protein product [Euphydryas editha]|uniref:Gag-like protein n=1 Tax=Euphydryas editha TaxID=104508 RepID=A0AAU9UBB2_EUPED|nr:unnamed protein product [Euphydryas editha]